MNNIDADVLIIGAGPSGSVAAKLLIQKGYSVIIIERQKFPRFSIGESLLPQCMVFLEEAGMSEAVKQHGFQFKDGAAFIRDHRHCVIDFNDKFSEGPSTTFQVQRGTFDKILADEAEKAGVAIHYEEEILSADFSTDIPCLTAKDLNTGNINTYRSKFVLDASGFGRVLPRLLDLETPSNFPVRQALFTHIEDNITAPDHDRSKILVGIHPDFKEVWYWLIPFSNGRCSLGVVAEREFFAKYDGTNEEKLKTIVNESNDLRRILADAKYDTPVNQIVGYSANVKSLHGNKFLLLGNAGEFLDPVFSSGVTIAMKSASMAANLLDKHFKGDAVNWQKDYAEELQRGVDVFRTYVEAWYDGRFQDILFHTNPDKKIISMIAAILAGYVWDETNQMVNQSVRRLNTLAEICKEV
jgi:flavin-dependent dehydrogenase